MNSKNSAASRGNDPARPPFGHAGTFRDRAAYGRPAELRFADFARTRLGCGVADLSALDTPRAGPPRLILPPDDGGPLPLPDFLLTFFGAAAYVEIKRHERATFHKASRRWMTGIEAQRFREYAAFRAESGTPLWIVFTHDEGPEGWLGAEVLHLEKHVSHEHSGMTYWPLTALRLIQTPNDLGLRATPQSDDEAGRRDASGATPSGDDFFGRP